MKSTIAQQVNTLLYYLQTKTQWKNAKAATVIVMNPKTGEILAMASRPTFNPNFFAVGISTNEWKNAAGGKYGLFFGTYQKRP